MTIVMRIIVVMNRRLGARREEKEQKKTAGSSAQHIFCDTVYPYVGNSCVVF